MLAFEFSHLLLLWNVIWSMNWGTAELGGSLLLPPKSTVCFFVFNLQKILQFSKRKQTFPEALLGWRSAFELYKECDISKDQNGEQVNTPFQKNTAQPGNVLLLVIHHSHNTSDGGVEWGCIKAQHYNQCPVWRRGGPPRGPSLHHQLKMQNKNRSLIL